MKALIELLLNLRKLKYYGKVQLTLSAGEIVAVHKLGESLDATPFKQGWEKLPEGY